MAKVHDRILSIAITSDESDNSVVVTSMTFYRDRGKLEASEGKTLVCTPGAASATAHETVLGEVIPPFSILRIVPTHQA